MLDLAAAPLETIRAQAVRAESQRPELSFDPPLARQRWFVCPTLTPLYYAPIYRELTADQRLRYNQLTALSFNELIAYFEQSFAASVLAALAQLPHGDRELAACLEGFLRDEEEHAGYWRRLNQLTEPGWYAHRERKIVRPPQIAQAALRFVTRRPQRFPLVFWVMLALEERSLEISRRCLRMPADQIEPHYREVYRQHLTDEVRHVQLDRHLIARYYAPLPLRQRQRNAWLLRQVVARFLLPPARTAVRVVRQLIREHPGLASRSGELIGQLQDVGRNADYHAVLFSRESTSLLFALFDHYPEMQPIERVLLSYRPQPPLAEGTAA